MDGEDWKSKSRPLNGHCTQISSVLHIPHVVMTDCVTDSCTAEKMCTNGQYSTTSHKAIPKPMSPSTAVFMITKAVRLWNAQDITHIFDQSPADEGRAVSPTATLL